MRSSFVRTMAFQSTIKFLPGSRWFLGSLEFLTDKFGDLSLQTLESSEIAGSSTDRLPPAPVRVGLINEAKLRHRLDSLGEMNTDPAEDKADHTLAVMAATIDPIHQPLSESNSEYGGEVYMVGQGDHVPGKTTKEIQREAKEEIAHAKRLARELDKRKGHNGLQDNSEGLVDEHRDGAPSRSHHPEFNSRRRTDRDQLWLRSPSIREEIGWVEYQGEWVYPMPAHNALAFTILVD
jgi:hypothetical protein